MLLATKTVVSELCKVSFLKAFFFFNQTQKVTEINFYQSFSCSVSAFCSKKAIQTPLKNMKIGQLDHNLGQFCTEAQKGSHTLNPPCLDPDKELKDVSALLDKHNFSILDKAERKT